MLLKGRFIKRRPQRTKYYCQFIRQIEQFIRLKLPLWVLQKLHYGIVTCRSKLKVDIFSSKLTYYCFSFFLLILNISQSISVNFPIYSIIILLHFPDLFYIVSFSFYRNHYSLGKKVPICLLICHKK